MDSNFRKFIRVESSDIIEIKPSDGISAYKKAVVKDFSMMGICFYSPVQWQYGQLLNLRYEVPGFSGKVELKIKIGWSELVDDSRGYLVGGEISYIEPKGVDCFLRYYYNQVKKLFS